MEGLVKFLVVEKGFKFVTVLHFHSLLYISLPSEERVRKGAEKLQKFLSAKQQGRLDGFFTVQPKEPKADKSRVGKGKGTDTKGKDAKGKETKAGAKRKTEEIKEGSTSKKSKTKK
jgi:flap endonuclease-1